MSKTISMMMHEKARNKPGSIALFSGEKSLTYSELDSLSNRFARMLQDAGCKKGDRVCLLMDKSIEAVVSLIGTVKAGAVYIPVSPETSYKAFEKTIRKGCITYIIANTVSGRHLLKTKENLQNAGERISIGWMGKEDQVGSEFSPEFLLRNINNYSPKPVNNLLKPSDPLFFYFKKHDGKKMKRIEFTHQNLMNCASWMVNHFKMDSSDRVCSAIQFHLTHFCFDLFGTLLSGASLDLVPDRIVNMPVNLARKISARNITHAIVCPSFLEYLIQEKYLSDLNFSALRHLMYWDKNPGNMGLNPPVLCLNGTTLTNLHSTLKSTRQIYPADFRDTNKNSAWPPNVIDRNEFNEEVFVFGDDLAGFSKSDSIMRLNHI